MILQKLFAWFAATPSIWVDYLYQALFPLGLKAFFWNFGAFLILSLLFLLIRIQKKRFYNQKLEITKDEWRIIGLWSISGIFFTPFMFVGAFCAGFYVIIVLLRLFREKKATISQKFVFLVESLFILLIEIGGIGILIFLWLKYSMMAGFVVIISMIVVVLIGVSALIAKFKISKEISSIMKKPLKAKNPIKITLLAFNILCGITFISAMLLPIHSVPIQIADNSSTFEFKTITFNIRNAGASEKKLQNNWQNRKSYLVEYINSLDLDFFGVQEAYFSQLEYIRSHLIDRTYRYTGVGRNDGVKGGEHAAIFYDSQLFKFLDGDSFWLSSTPSIPSKQWEKSNYRICTWVLFEHQASKVRFFVFNTHFAEPKYPEVHIKAAELIIEKIESLCGDLPIILMGDFNMINTTDAYHYITNHEIINFRDSYVEYHNGSTPFDYTNNQFGQVSENEKKRIDYIFISYNIVVDECSILKDSYSDGLFYSDHFPVLLKATIVI
ncbi:MAG: endonuclease/exonuclease/phosphatase family protein [Promethearchaeota archaeon]